MTIDPGLLVPKIKTSIRISHARLDDDIEDTILAALKDLQVCGITAPPAEDPDSVDPLILNAVKLYCKAEYTDDTAKAAEYQRRYDSMKSSLMMAEGYREVASNE